MEADSVAARAKQGGNAAFLASLEPGSLSMADRGRFGGRPKEPPLGEVIK